MTPHRIYTSFHSDGTRATLYIDGKHYERDSSIPELREAVVCYLESESEDDFDNLMELLENRNQFSTLFGGSFVKASDGRVFLEGTSVPLPSRLIRMLEKVENEGGDTSPLTNFWSLTLLNPDADARDRFITYIDSFGVPITSAGYAILYKAVTHKTKKVVSDDLIAYVGTQYLKYRRAGMNPREVNVFSSAIGFRLSSCDSIEGWENLGNLRDLHEDIPTLDDHETVYTDKHTRTMDIHPGVVVRMERQGCDPIQSNDCSRGLHVGSFQYVRSFANQNDTIFACLVNPAHVVAVPLYDHSKLRVCEYFPYAMMEREGNGNWTEIEEGFFEEDYAMAEIEAIKKQINEGSSYTLPEEARVTAVGRLEVLEDFVGESSDPWGVRSTPRVFNTCEDESL